MRKATVITVLALAAARAYGDAWDPGDNTGAGANPLAVATNLQIHGLHSLSNLVDDVADWFSFQATPGKRYRFESTGEPGTDTEAFIYSDSAGLDEVVADKDTGIEFNFQLLFQPDSAGTYYLKIVDEIAAAESAISYTLQYIEEPILDAWDPADDDVVGASLLTIDLPAQTHGLHNLSSSDTIDWFKVYLLPDVEYTFEAVNGGWDTKGTLYYEGSSEVAFSDDTLIPGDNELNFQMVYSPVLEGYYYLKVEAYDAGSDLNYQLRYWISSAPDMDGDGMLDAWEIQYLGGTNALPSANADGDPQVNLAEYISGTDPTNPASFFSATGTMADDYILHWNSVALRNYQVLWSGNLTNGFVPVGPVVVHPQHSYTDTVHSAAAAGFYKVQVQLQ